MGNDEHLRTSQANKNLSQQNEKLVKKCEELEKEKLIFSKNYHEIEKELQQSKERALIAERNFSEYDFKIKDYLREIEILKSSNKSNIQVQEELMQESIQINQLKSKISQKDIEIEDIKKDNALQLKSYKDEITKLGEKIEIYEDKISAFKSLNNENEKLKIKIKELSLLKDKQFEYDELSLNLESKTRMIDSLIKEKQTYITQIEKLNKDILIEKDKSRQTEFERKKLEFEMNDYRKENSRMENQIKNTLHQAQNYSTLNGIKKPSSNNVNNSVYGNEITNQGNALYDLDQSSVLYEIEKTKDDRFKLLERENEELRLEKMSLTNSYKQQVEEVNQILLEKDKNLSLLEAANLELKKISNERDKIILEKEKLLLKIQKIELDYQRSEITSEGEKAKIENEINILNDKLRKLTNEKDSLSREFEQFKKEQNELQSNFNKEKQLLLQEQSKEMEKIKNLYDKETLNLKNKIKQGQVTNSGKEKQEIINQSSINNAIQNEENYSLKLEIQNLKLNLSQKEEIIKGLHSKTKSLEFENNDYNIQMQDSVNKFNQDIIKRSEDLDFYKKSYEEQKNRVNREHELISSSLYELALQFMSLKNELQKKVTTGNSQQNWLDQERNKNFPLENK